MELVKIHVCRDSMEAHFLRQVLEDEDIQATVMGEALAAGRGELPLTAETLPSVWVRQDDVERAREVLERAVRPGPTASDEDEGDEPPGDHEPAFEDEPPDEPADPEEPQPAGGIVSQTVGLLLSWAVCVGLGVWLVWSMRYALEEMFRAERHFAELLGVGLAFLMQLAGMVIVVAGLYLVTRAYVRALRKRRQAG